VRATSKRFIEVYVVCDEATLCERDPKGLYEKAKRGEISSLPGMGAPYDPPKTPELRIDTVDESPNSAARRILEYLQAG
jgi:adenylylsulfate kinase-like enzyme